ncbi:MAG: CNNM domain-containing protein, partial [Acidobacteriota bacterium]
MIQAHIYFYLAFAFLLVAGNAFFVAAEFAIVKVRATRIQEMATSGLPGSQLAREVVGHLDEYLSACQLGITIVSLGLGWVGEEAFAGLL